MGGLKHIVTVSLFHTLSALSQRSPLSLPTFTVAKAVSFLLFVKKKNNITVMVVTISNNLNKLCII